MTWKKQCGNIIQGTEFQNLVERYNGNGVITGLAVTDTDVTPDMIIHIAAGSWFAGETYNTTAGVTDHTISAHHDTLDRYDIVYATTSNTIDVVDGTPAADPIVPDLPADSVLLAIIKVAKTVTVINQVDILDCRLDVNVENTVLMDVTLPIVNTTKTNHLCFEVPARCYKVYIRTWLEAGTKLHGEHIHATHTHTITCDNDHPGASAVHRENTSAGQYSYISSATSGSGNTAVTQGYPNGVKLFIGGSDRSTAVWGGTQGAGSADVATGEDEITTYMTRGAENYLEFQTTSGACQIRMLIYCSR